MRFLLSITFPVEKFNQMVRDGLADNTMARIIEDAKPEAAYFFAHDHKRGGFLIINMNSASELPRFAEPWMLQFNSSIDIQPVMTPDDLKQAGLDALARKWK